jgi:hypothetical protein
LDEKLEADLVDFVTAIESACFDFKQRIAQKHGVADQEGSIVSEINFNLNFSEFNTQKLGTFEVAEEKDNTKDGWSRAFNILKQDNATISSRYHSKDYLFSYWLYNGKIYRQKLKR